MGVLARPQVSVHNRIGRLQINDIVQHVRLIADEAKECTRLQYRSKADLACQWSNPFLSAMPRKAAFP
jgi:hypothetical protein